MCHSTRSRSGASDLLISATLPRECLAGTRRCGPETRDATLDKILLHRRAQDLDAAEPLGPTFVEECSWYAVPTSDQAAVLDAFQLTDAVPVGFREAAWLFDAQGDLPPDKAVVVTPAFDGWTQLVHRGALNADLEALSARFGAAHFYGHGYQSGCGDWSEWTVAEQGKVLQIVLLRSVRQRLHGSGEPRRDACVDQRPATTGGSKTPSCRRSRVRRLQRLGIRCRIRRTPPVGLAGRGWAPHHREGNLAPRGANRVMTTRRCQHRICWSYGPRPDDR